jgi:hypothetical protein
VSDIYDPLYGDAVVLITDLKAERDRLRAALERIVDRLRAALERIVDDDTVDTDVYMSMKREDMVALARRALEDSNGE